MKLKGKSKRENIPFHTNEVLYIFYSLLLETQASTFYFVKGREKKHEVKWKGYWWAEINILFIFEWVIIVNDIELNVRSLLFTESFRESRSYKLPLN